MHPTEAPAPTHEFEPYDANPTICRHCGAVKPMPCYGVGAMPAAPFDDDDDDILNPGLGPTDEPISGGTSTLADTVFPTAAPSEPIGVADLAPGLREALNALAMDFGPAGLRAAVRLLYPGNGFVDGEVFVEGNELNLHYTPAPVPMVELPGGRFVHPDAVVAVIPGTRTVAAPDAEWPGSDVEIPIVQVIVAGVYVRIDVAELGLPDDGTVSPISPCQIVVDMLGGQR